MENPKGLQEVKETQHVIEMYEQKLHQLQSQLVTSCMMKRELSVDLEALQTLQKEKPPFVSSSADDTLKFTEAYVQSSRKQFRQLKEELEARSVCSLLSNETLFKTQLELQWKEAELTQTKVQIMQLHGLLKEKKEMLQD